MNSAKEEAVLANSAMRILRMVGVSLSARRSSWVMWIILTEVSERGVRRKPERSSWPRVEEAGSSNSPAEGEATERETTRIVELAEVTSSRSTWRVIV